MVNFSHIYIDLFSLYHNLISCNSKLFLPFLYVFTCYSDLFFLQLINFLHSKTRTINKVSDETADPVACKQLIDEWYQDPEILGAEGFGWALEIAAEVNAMIEDPTIALITPCQAATIRYNEIQGLCDNLKYQRDNYTGACERLEIVDLNNPRLRSMPRGKTLYLWQIPVIDAIQQFSKSNVLRGCVLADDMGLGKTITAAGYLLRVSLY